MGMAGTFPRKRQCWLKNSIAGRWSKIEPQRAVGHRLRLAGLGSTFPCNSGFNVGPLGNLHEPVGKAAEPSRLNNDGG